MQVLFSFHGRQSLCLFLVPNDYMKLGPLVHILICFCLLCIYVFYFPLFIYFFKFTLGCYTTCCFLLDFCIVIGRPCYSCTYCCLAIKDNVFQS